MPADKPKADPAQEFARAVAMMKKPPPELRKKKKPPPPDRKAPKKGWRKWLYWAIIAELAGVVLFIGALLIGEQSRLTLLTLYFPRHPLLLGTVLGASLAHLTRHKRMHVRVLQVANIVMSLIVLFPVMGMNVAFSQKSDRPIHLASYNVYFGKAGRQELSDEIATFNADIIVLQAGYGSLGEKLTKQFPERTVYQEGEFVLVSKLKVLKVLAPKPKPGPTPQGTPLMFMKYIIETPQGVLHLYNVHPFSPRHALFGDTGADDNIETREAQINGAISDARDDTPPYIIVGDTNLPVMSGLAREHFAGLNDAFSEVGFGFGYTFPTKKRWMRIDRCLSSDTGVKFLNFRVGDQGASDHRPIFIDFELDQQVPRSAATTSAPSTPSSTDAPDAPDAAPSR